MSAQLEGTQSAADAIARVKYSHDAMIDMLLANPNISQNDLALAFGYTVPWVSRVMNSDAFLARLAERKTDLIDPTIVRNIEHKLKALADTALDIVHDGLARTRNPDMAFRALELSTKALNYGARPANLNVQQFVVALPSKADSDESWVSAHSPRGVTIEQEK